MNKKWLSSQEEAISPEIQAEWHENYCPQDCTIITWPDSQDYMDEEWWDEHAELISDKVGLAIYGSSAFIVPNEFING